MHRWKATSSILSVYLFMLIEKSISTNIKTCKDFDYDLTIEHILRWNVLSRRATLQHLLWKTFEMKCILSSERVGEKNVLARRRIFNISDTINCFKPFKRQAALFKLEIVSVSTFRLVGGLDAFCWLTQRNFIYLHFIKRVPFSYVTKFFGESCRWTNFNGRWQHLLHTDAVCVCASSIVLSTTTKWI